MIDERSDSIASCGENASAAAQEANGIAFLLASAAYLTLAGAHLRREGSDGLALMDAIEDQISEAMDSFAAEHPNDVAQPDIILHAMRKVRVLLDAGRSMAPEGRSLQ
ncbi:hypothetical protein ASG32_27335 [Methylobacterium sp. Leaf361]|uniref:hypothetical protein n=1 Tax=Methylobacterium sp. Leaf361 TaxID=1736352 RepID=UPI0006F9D3EA|nr:hypothetical protein [Methylobacterium sp. Leaf361]KQS75480.1 hypothetical protein ASG32_27335 [Methylobacterium sp. Leaf361]